MSAQNFSPNPQVHTAVFHEGEDDFVEKRSSGSLVLFLAGAFVVGLLVGWFVMGWYLFPVKYSETYPSDLRSDIADDYILMVAEAYASTHDLRTAAKRLRYWEPETLAVRIRQMSQALEKVEPERSAYLQVLAKDLHLNASAAAPAQPTPVPSSPSRSLPISSLLGLAAVLVLLAIAFYLAYRRGLLDSLRGAVEPEEVAAPPSPTPRPSTDATYQDMPVHSMPVTQPLTESEGEERVVGQEDGGESMVASDYEFIPMPEREAVWMPATQDETASAPAPWEPDYEEDVEGFEEPIATPDDLMTAPVPPFEEEGAATVSSELEAGQASLAEAGQIKVLQFDGSPDYNVIAPIELGDDFGQFVLGVALTAPHNPNQVIALEAMLYDRTDIRTVSALLAPPVLANDPELLHQFTDKDQDVFPLQPGQTFHLETAYLMVSGKVRRVQFGPHTRDGVPVIEFAEIEFSARHAGEAL